MRQTCFSEVIGTLLKVQLYCMSDVQNLRSVLCSTHDASWGNTDPVSKIVDFTCDNRLGDNQYCWKWKHGSRFSTEGNLKPLPKTLPLILEDSMKPRELKRVVNNASGLGSFWVTKNKYPYYQDTVPLASRTEGLRIVSRARIMSEHSTRHWDPSVVAI